MSGEKFDPTDMNMNAASLATAHESVSGLHAYNSAADLTNQHQFTLENGEFLFDVNTRNSCTRPLSTFITSLAKSNVYREFASFTSLPLTRPRVIDTFFDEPALNKFAEIGVYEQTRVRAPHKSGHNYINATWVDGFKESRKYIVAQSPLADAVDQFWTMIYDRKSHVTVFLSEMIDENKKPYMPSTVGEVMKFETISVELEHIRKIKPNYYSALLKVTKDKLPTKHIIALIMNWGPSAYPSRPTDVLNLIDDMNNMREIMKAKAIEENTLEVTASTPITIVCFEGSNSSCAITGLDILCQRLEQSTKNGTPYVDVLDTIARLRMLRGGAVWKAEIYVFMQMAVLEFAVRRRIISTDLLSRIDLTSFIINH